MPTTEAPEGPALALRIEEAARMAGVGRTTLFYEIGAGRLIARKVGRRTVIRRQDLDAWLEALPAAGADVESLPTAEADR